MVSKGFEHVNLIFRRFLGINTAKILFKISWCVILLGYILNPARQKGIKMKIKRINKGLGVIKIACKNYLLQDLAIRLNAIKGIEERDNWRVLL